MQTLIPEPVSAQAHPKGKRLGRLLGFGATPRFLLLLAASVLLSIPSFFNSRAPWWMFACDALLLAAWIADAVTLASTGALHADAPLRPRPGSGQTVPG